MRVRRKALSYTPAAAARPVDDRTASLRAARTARVRARPHHPASRRWTPGRQRRFIAALSVIGTVTDACRAVGVSVRAADALRRRPGVQSLVVARDIALQMAVDRLFGAAMERALHGYTRPIRRGGIVVGQRHCLDRNLLGKVIRRNREGLLSRAHDPS